MQKNHFKIAQNDMPNPREPHGGTPNDLKTRCQQFLSNPVQGLFIYYVTQILGVFDRFTGVQMNLKDLVTLLLGQLSQIEKNKNCKLHKFKLNTSHHDNKESFGHPNIIKELCIIFYLLSTDLSFILIVSVAHINTLIR